MKSWRLAQTFLFVIFFCGGGHSFVASPAETTNGFTVTLRFGGTIALSPEATQTLYTNALALLRSSNFNSRAPRWEWKMNAILEGHRKTIAGDYLLVSFKEPQAFKTVGGEVSVREIVIGLNRSDYASSLYTIDDELRIVGHSKYSGGLCVQMLSAVKQIASR